jgi:cytochrome b561
MTTARFSTAATDNRYNAVAQWLHWITAILVLTTLPIAWVMINMARDNPSAPTLVMIHKSLGVTIFAVVAFRILWRGLSPAPPLLWTLEPWEAWTARISHVLLYLVLLGLPISGYVFSAASNHPVKYFNLFTLPLLPEDKPLAHAAGEVHEALSWALYALLGLHILGTAYHLILKRDDVLDRMLPKQFNAD